MKQDPLSSMLAPVARVMLAAMFIMSGFSKLGDIPGNMAFVESGGLPGIAVYGAIVLEIAGGIALAVGFRARIAALALAGFSLVTAVLYHLIPAGGAEGMEATIQMIMFMKNVSIAGGLLMVVALGAGGWALDNALPGASARRA
jgi:putative oxidoreductase